MNSSQAPGTGGQKWLAAVSIPMVLLILLGAGGYLGHLADRRFGVEPWGLCLGLLAGIVAAIFRIRILLRTLSDESGK